MSTRPKGVMHSPKVASDLENVLAALVCVEEFDDHKCGEEAVQVIEEHLQTVKADSVAVVPFAHLSSYLASSEVAIPIISQISATLKNDKLTVSDTSFGYHKTMDLAIEESSVYGHPGSVAFRRIPADPGRDLTRIAHEVGRRGISKLIAALPVDEVEQVV